VLDVLFAGPHHLHGIVDLLGDLDRRDHHVRLELAAETAAEQMLVDDHLVDGKAGGLRCFRLHAGHDLRAGPDLAGIRPDVDGGVDRLHRGMREERQLVGRLEPVAAGKRLGDVAVGFCDRAVLLAGLAQIVPDVLGGDIGVRSLVPLDLERFETFLRRPHVIADHGDGVVEHDDLAYAGDFRRGAVVDLADLAAEHRAIGDRGDLHAGQDRVNAVESLAVDLVRRIEPLQRLADQDEILGILDGDVLRRRLALGCERERAIAELAAACGMRDLALRRRAASGLDAPLAGRGLHQHRAGGGAGLAQRQPPGADRVGIAGDLETEGRIAVELVVGRRVLDLDLAPVGI
jgi:hypothetical protein